MIFDEQPDGDPHGECAAEIHKLEQELHDKMEELACCESDLLRWRKSYEEAVSENFELRADVDELRRQLKYPTNQPKPTSKERGSV